MRTVVFAVVVGLAFQAASPARAEDGADPFRARAVPVPKGAAERVSFQIEDGDLSDLVKAMSELTGKRFVVATAKAKTVKASVYASQKITVEEAYHAFLAVLQANGLTVLPEGALYKIVETPDAARQTTPIVGEVPAEERYVTHVHRLVHVGAEEVAALLGKLQTRDGSVVPYVPGNLLIVTDTGTNVRRMLDIVRQIDVGGEADKLYVEPLYYASASDVEKKLTELLDLKKQIDAPARAGDLHVARLVALDRPNALAIVASDASYRRLVEVIRRVDMPVTSEGEIHVVPLQHADATKVVGPLNEALGGAHQAGAGGQAGSAPTAGAAVRPGALNVLDAAVKVSADPTTNALLVTSSARDFAAIKDVIDRLDLPKRQVYIEAVVMDVSVEHGLDLGFGLHAGSTVGANGEGFAYGGFRAGSSALPPSAADLQAFALGVQGPEIPLPFSIPVVGTSTTISKIPSLGAFISAAATAHGTDILSTPNVIASDNTQAELKVQLHTSVTPHAPGAPVIAGGAQLTPFGSSSPNNLQAIGPRIRITPHLNDSNEVRLDVDETISDIESVPDKSDLYGSITWIERSATTTLTVKDQETVVIGGLVRNRLARTETKTPILGDIPLLGALFRSRSDQVEKSNLVLVLTPHIIRDEADLRRIFERKMQERQEMVDRAAIFGDLAWTPPVDYARTRGLVHEIRAHQREVEGKRKLDELRAPREVKQHEPGEPLELPTTAQAARGASPQAPAASSTPPDPKRDVSPPGPQPWLGSERRGVEHLER